ncbi:MAG: ribosome small subunit-dependent GTPase A [Bifidobacteriaceae bacterium]|nr:ribosome small subunit-dependent GTPase A [Bifidobacteriaceae bacterium]
MTPARWERLTADDVRVRPGRGSRPRTKTRPSHADAVPARVIAVDRGRYLTRLEGRQVEAIKAKELGHQSVVVGDLAYLVGDVSGAKDTLARVVRIEPRRTVLRRATDEGRGRERVIVANAERLVVVTALASPPPRPRMIDRCLVAAYDGGLDAVICLTKADLGSDAELRALYEPLGIQVVATGLPDDSGAVPTAPEPGDIGQLEGLEQVRELLAGRVSVLVGHSGVGKSTLVNALVPGAGRATGAVNDVTGRGRHTSSSAVAMELPGGGWVIDTPGVRSFGLDHVEPQHVLAAFPDLAQVAQADCPRGCPHSPGALDCALEQWAAGDSARQARVESFQRLLASRDGQG